jgi:type III restriction enzyme
MLKEGWDVTNLYTIVPLRAANARTLIEQSIGRGLRLPYGKRTGVIAVDRLNIIAHDKFQEIIDEANRPDSTIRLQQVILSSEQLDRKLESVVSQSALSAQLGIGTTQRHQNSPSNKTQTNIAPLYSNPVEQKIAQLTYQAIQNLAKKTDILPSASYLSNVDVQKSLVEEVMSIATPVQLELEGIRERPNIEAIVAKTSQVDAAQTIDIPRILVVPKEEVKSGYKPFHLDLATLNFSAPTEELWIQHLRINKLVILGLGKGGIEEKRLEDFIVSGLIDFDDISYDNHANMLYNLASQTVQHFLKYLTEDDTRKVLRLHQREIARFIHSQMQNHYWEDTVDYDVVINSGFTELKESAYSAEKDVAPLDYRQAPTDKSNMARYLFAGYSRCLYQVQKFHSDSERKLAIILERESIKWFRPAKGQFQIFYKLGTDHFEYQPDFVAETDKCIYMLEPKAKNEMTTPEVAAKTDAAVKWCKNATNHSKTYNSKPWKYLLMPHDIIAENMTLSLLSSQFEIK